MKRILLTGSILTLLLSTQTLLAQPNKEINDKLNTITYMVVNDQSMEIPADSILRKYIKIELISDNDFLTRKKTAKNLLVEDTAKFRKKKGVLRLPTVTGSKSFKDKITDGDDREEYQYLGHIPFLNAYVVYCMFWESVNYKLISKKNGTMLSDFGAMPYLSPDKKRIITVDADAYENDAGISLFSVVNGIVKNKLHVRFRYWMPGADADMFWGSDGKFYM